MSVTELNSDVLLHSVPVHEGYKVLGGVVLYSKLGQGGMGAVYRGRHLRLGIDVALKVLSPPAGASAEPSEEFVKRFTREAKTAASITHQNLVRVMDVGSEGGVHYLVMDFVDGESARDRLERRKKLTELEVTEICLGAAEGLGAAHRKGIVHRDVKPDNIMIDKDGCVRVTDLGLARTFAGGEGANEPTMLTQTQTAMGTPYYMSPEQFASARGVTPPADVWSLGVTMYQLVTGKVPWTDTSVFLLANKIINAPHPDLRSQGGISDGLAKMIERALKKDPHERYADCTEMAEVLRRHASEIGVTGKSVLPDDAAGTTRTALADVTPPKMDTITLISAGLERSSPTPKAEPSPTRDWKLPAAVGGALAALVLAIILAILLLAGGTGKDVRTSAEQATLQAPAREDNVPDAAPAPAPALAALPEPEISRKVDTPSPPPRSTMAAIASDVSVKKVRVGNDPPGVTSPRPESKRAEIPSRRVDIPRPVASPPTPPSRRKGPLGIEVVLIRGGTFRMGSASGELDERPVHEVTLRGFYIGRYEVTRAQFEAYRRRLDAPVALPKKEGNLPAMSVSWHEAVDFCRYVTRLDREGATWRLPTEAEWEYSARGREGRIYPWGNASAGKLYANLVEAALSHGGPAPVGSFPAGATPEGVMDLIGNAAEWCADRYGDYSGKSESDPRGSPSGTRRVVRGQRIRLRRGHVVARLRSGRERARHAEGHDRLPRIEGAWD